MPKLVHITDIHIVPEGEVVVGLDSKERLLQVIHSVNQDHSDAALCVFTGDLTDRGDLASYRVLAECLKELRIPFRLLLGNHDNREAFRKVFTSGGANSQWAHSVEDLGDVRLFFLDTLDDNRPDTGLLCADRLAWLAQRLEEAAGRRVVIFMHHPPRSVGITWFDNMMLTRPEEFWRVVDRHPSVEHIVFGHLHLTTTGRWGRISYSCNRGTCHRIALDFRAEAVEFVESEPTYDIVVVSETGIMVHHTAPKSASRLIAREYPTPDGKGRLEYLESRK